MTIATAPATCANLGPGFDSFGIAISGYRTLVEVSPLSSDRVTVLNEGPFASDFPEDETHTAAQVVMGLTGASGWSIRVHSDIPHGGGLGSSAALITAAVGAAWEWRRPEVTDLLTATSVFEHLMGNPPKESSEQQAWLANAFADALDSHRGQPDNPAAAYLGGLTAAAIVNGRAIADSFYLDPATRLVVIAPNRQILTADARAALPDMVPRVEAVETVHHAVLMLSRLRDLATFPDGLGVDHLHEKYRRSLFPESADTLSRMRAAGATTVCVSGSGPTLLGICHRDVADRVREAGAQTLHKLGVDLRFTAVVEPDFSGLQVNNKQFRIETPV